MTETPEKEAPKKDTKALNWIFLILAFAFVALVIIVIATQTSKNAEIYTNYNGFKIFNLESGYRVSVFINENQAASNLYVRNSPVDLEDVVLEGNIQDLVTNKDIIYTVIDPTEDLNSKATIAALEIDSVIDNPVLFNIKVDPAFTQDPDESGMDVKTCAQASDTVAIIWIKKGEANKLYQDQGCWILEGTTEDEMIRVADRLVLTLLGIMEQ